MRLLVVEDDWELTQTLSELLEQEGHEDLHIFRAGLSYDAHHQTDAAGRATI